MKLLYIFVVIICPILGDKYHPKFHSQKQQRDVLTEDIPYWQANGRDGLEKAKNTYANIIEAPAKNIIIFVGDGMNLPTLTAARIHKAQRNSNYTENGEESFLFFETFPHVGLSKTYSVDHQTPDSSSTATAMFTGVKTNSGTLGFDANIMQNDADSIDVANEVESIMLHAQRAGKDTGFVTTTRVTHATPASLYAHSAGRDWECWRDLKNDDLGETEGIREIAWQLVNRAPGNATKVMMGGGERTMRPKNDTQTRDDDYSDDYEGYQCYTKDKDFVEEFQNASANNVFVGNLADLEALDVTKTERLLGLFSPTHMVFDHERRNNLVDIVPDSPSVADMTKKAIEMLSKNTEKGFFLMVEGGRIDHAHHDVWANTALDETIAFDKAIETAFNMTNHRETLIIVTSDHGHTFNFAGYPDRGTDVRGMVMNGGEPYLGAGDKLPYAIMSYAQGEGYDKHLFVDEAGNLTRLDLRGEVNMTDEFKFKFPSSVPKSSETHSGADVGIFASGPFSHYFHGVHEQTHIFYVMAYSGCLGPFENEPHCQIVTTTPETNPTPTQTPPYNLSVRSSKSSLELSLVATILLWILIQ